MHKNAKDLTGMRFGRWTVIRATEQRQQRSVLWECRCECGLVELKPAATLRKTRSTTCRGHNENHDMSYSSEYTIWKSMRRRCNNPQYTHYYNYGGRGIQVCERWDASFDAFIEDMGRKPTAQHTLERIDNDGDYCPENCRWATRKEQAHNMRKNRSITFNGRTMILSDWANELGLRRSHLAERIKKYGIEIAFSGIKFHRWTSPLSTGEMT